MEPDPQKWDQLAQAWVETHQPDKQDLNTPEGIQAYKEWMQRRAVSQFLSKMGYLMLCEYMSRSDLFMAVPETRRILLVIAPIDKCIIKTYGSREKSVAKWDIPIREVVFDQIIEEYDAWYKTEGYKLTTHSGKGMRIGRHNSSISRGVETLSELVPD
jgi:hypothetical protein